MQSISQYAPESGLKIYEPMGRQITDEFFCSEQQQSRLDNASPLKRQDTLIDQLQYKEESSRRTSHGGEKLSSISMFPKSTSIQLMVDQESKKNGTKREYNNIQEMFASRPELQSKEIISALLKGVNNTLFQVNQRYSLQESLNNSKSAIQSPSKQQPSSDPQRPNLSRPFLRKKPTSKESSFQSSQNLPKKDEVLSIQRNRLQIQISALKQYNNDLMPIFRSLLTLQHQQSQEWRSLKPKEMELLKLMIEKAIISKEVR